MKMQRSIAAIAVLGLGLSVAGCSSSSSEDPAAAGTTIEWWHIQTGETGSGIWQELADEFEAENPGVTIDITVQDGSAFRPALDARIQAGDTPDLFQAWAGAGFENQVSAGAVKDITEATEPWIDGLAEGPVDAVTIDEKRYAVPYNAGLTGFWYNKALFAKAGIDSPPQTWEEFTAAITALKDSGVTPIAVAGFDKYPLQFYYSQLALRIGGADALNEAVASGNFEDPMFIEAGEKINELLELDAFQEGFIAAPFAEAGGEASLVANGQAAMDLMGQWAPASMATVAENGVGLGEDLGWFPFPTVPGGEGELTDGYGGTDSFAVGKDAPAEAVEFLEFISSPESAKKIAEGGELLPVTLGSAEAVSDPNLKNIAKALETSTTVTNFLDQSVAPPVATAMNDNIAGIFARSLTPEEAAKALAEAAKAQ
jgi:raffinose/stachyose/melibiose transport system substrate-binding protein